MRHTPIGLVYLEDPARPRDSLPCGPNSQELRARESRESSYRRGRSQLLGPAQTNIGATR